MDQSVALHSPSDAPTIAQCVEGQEAAGPALGGPALEDPELEALPAPPKRQRTFAVALMSVAAIASAVMCWALRSEVSYATADSRPTDVGDLAAVNLSTMQSNQYVEARGVLDSKGAIRYTRPFEGDTYRLQRIVGTSNIWVETRIPEGFQGPRFVPPQSFTGRLVRFSHAGLRHSGVTKSVAQYTGHAVPSDAWLLVDGASPRASQWALALMILFAAFALWNTASVVRVLRPVR